MSNTLTNLIPDLYSAIDVVSRELVGFIPAVTLDASATRAAVGETIRVPITPAAAAEDVTPGTTPPDTGDQAIGNAQLSITKARTVPFRWTGEEQKGLNNGPGYASIRVQQIAQAIRTLVNEVESDIALLYKKSSRAYGTAGTTPFASNLSEAAQVLKILKDNGAPEGDLHLIIGTTAGANMRSLSQLSKANEAGDDSMLRQGVLLNLFGMMIRESAQVKTHVIGAGASYQVNHAAYSIGDTDITVDTGSGTIVAGDVVTAAGDANKYIVGTPLAANVFSLNKPGLRAALADNAALTVGAAYTANMAFHRSAMVLVARPPALPEEGDMAEDRMLVTDPRSGLVFEVAMYKQYRRIRYEISLAWGASNIKSEHTATLLG
ncbi:MAG: hypothetical protein QOD00_1707 [Blastocatellia bacterium]|jgi:hypothetical protein|nr:hypothetical protein [Blastocatellia bacterium]